MSEMAKKPHNVGTARGISITVKIYSVFSVIRVLVEIGHELYVVQRSVNPLEILYAHT